MLTCQVPFDGFRYIVILFSGNSKKSRESRCLRCRFDFFSLHGFDMQNVDIVSHANYLTFTMTKILAIGQLLFSCKSVHIINYYSQFLFHHHSFYFLNQQSSDVEIVSINQIFTVRCHVTSTNIFQVRVLYSYDSYINNKITDN